MKKEEKLKAERKEAKKDKRTKAERIEEAREKVRKAQAKERKEEVLRQAQKRNRDAGDSTAESAEKNRKTQKAAKDFWGGDL